MTSTTNFDLLEYNLTEGPTKNETLKINTRKGILKMQVNGLSFIDKDTNQHIIFIPSLELSAYGETKAKAKEMIIESFKLFSDHIIEMSDSARIEYIASLGWKRNSIFPKQFSKAYIDENGVLQNFNAIDSSIEKFALATA